MDRPTQPKSELADRALATEKEARAESDRALEMSVDREALRYVALREAMALVEVQREIVDGSLVRLLASVPRGTFDGRLTADVEKIRAANIRMRRLLEDVLDPDDKRGRYHEVGGSG